jgi:hypothetical protein
MKSYLLLTSIMVVIGLGIGLSINASAEENLIPSWIKNTAGWWASGSIGDTEFLKAIEYLVSENIIQTSTPKATAEPQFYVVTDDTYIIWGMSSSANGQSKHVRCNDNDIAISGGFEAPYNGIFAKKIKPDSLHQYSFSLVNVGSDKSGGMAKLYVTCMKVD